MAGLQDLVVTLRLAADEFNAGIQKATSTFGAFKTLFAEAIAVAPFAAITSAAMQMDEAMDRLSAKTGAAGKELENLGETVQSVMKAVPASMGESANAVASFSTRLGLSGEALTDITTKVGLLADRMGTNFTATADEAARTFAAWNISTDKQSKALDFLLGVSQRTGTGVNELMGSANALRPITEALGLSFEKTAAFVGQLNQNAIPVGPVMYGLRTIMKQFTDEGVDTRQGLQALFEAIRNMDEGSKQAQQTMQLFGARGQALFAAIKAGKLDMDALAASIESSGESVTTMAARTRSFGDIMGELQRRVQLIAAQLGKDFVDALGKLADMLIPVLDYIEGLARQFGDLPDNIQVATLAFLAFGAAATPLLGPLNALIVAAGAAALAFAAMDLTKPADGMKRLGEAGKQSKSDLDVLRETVAEAWAGLRDLGNIVVSVGASFTPVFTIIRDLALKFYESALVPMLGAFGSLLEAIAPVANVIGGILYVALRAVADVLRIMLNPAFEVLGTMATQASWVFKNVLSPVVDFLVGGLKQLVEWMEKIPVFGDKIKSYVKGYEDLKAGAEKAASGAVRLEQDSLALLRTLAQMPDANKRFNDAVLLLQPSLEGVSTAALDTGKALKGAGDAADAAAKAAAAAAVQHLIQKKALDELAASFSALGMKDVSQEFEKLNKAYSDLAKSGQASSEEMATARDNLKLLQDQLKETPQRMAFSILGVNTDSLKTAYDALQQMIGLYNQGAITLPILTAAQDNYNKKLNETTAAAEKALPSFDRLYKNADLLAGLMLSDFTLGLKETDQGLLALEATLTKSGGDFKAWEDAINDAQRNFANWLAYVSEPPNFNNWKAEFEKFDPSKLALAMKALSTEAEVMGGEFNKAGPPLGAMQDAFDLLGNMSGSLFQRFENLSSGITKVSATVTELKERSERLNLEYRNMVGAVDASGKALFTEGQIRGKHVEAIQAEIDYLRTLGPAYSQQIQDLEDLKKKLGEVTTARSDMARLGVSDIGELQRKLDDDTKAYERLRQAGMNATQAMQAEIATLKDRIELARANGQSTDAMERSLGKLEEKVKGHASIWRDMYNQVSTIISDMGKQMAESIMNLFDTSANDALNKQAEDLRRALDEQTAQYESHVADLLVTYQENTENAQVELDKQLADLKHSLEEKQLAYDRSVEDLKTRYQRETRDLKEQLEDRQRDYKHWVEDQQAKLKELEGDNSDSAKRQREDILRSLRQRAEDEADYAREISTKQADIENDYQTSLQRQADDFERFKGDLAIKQDEANADYRTKLEEQTSDLQDQLNDARAEYEKFKADNKTKLDEIQAQHKGIFDRIGDMFGGMLDSMGEALLRFATEKLGKLLFDKLGDLVTKILPGVGKSFDSVFGKGGTADAALSLLGDRWNGIVGSLSNVLPGIGGSAAGAAGGMIDLGYTVPGAAGGAGGAAGGVGGIVSGGLTGVLGAVGGIGSMVSGIIGNFQSARQETTLNAIEGNTRLHKILFEIWFKEYWSVYMTAVYAIHDTAVAIQDATSHIWNILETATTASVPDPSTIQAASDQSKSSTDTLIGIWGTLKEILLTNKDATQWLNVLVNNFTSWAVQILDVVRGGIGTIGAGTGISLPGGGTIAPGTPLWQVPAQLGAEVTGESTARTPVPVAAPTSAPAQQNTQYDLAMQSRAMADAISKPTQEAMAQLGDVITNAQRLTMSSLGVTSPGIDQAFKDMAAQLQGLAKTPGLTPDQLSAITDEIAVLMGGMPNIQPGNSSVSGVAMGGPETGADVIPKLAAPPLDVMATLQDVMAKAQLLTMGSLGATTPGIEQAFKDMATQLQGLIQTPGLTPDQISTITEEIAELLKNTVLPVVPVTEEVSTEAAPVDIAAPLATPLTNIGDSLRSLSEQFAPSADWTDRLERIGVGIDDLWLQGSPIPGLLGDIRDALMSRDQPVPSVTVIVQGNMIGNEAAADDMARLISTKLRIQGVPF